MNSIASSRNFCRENVNQLSPYIPGYQPDLRKGFIKLNSNENPYPPSPRVIAALRDQIGDNLRLYPNSRSISLRQGLASRYHLAEEQVFTANGSDELISLIFRTFTENNDQVLFSFPTYTFYKSAAQIHAVNYHFIDTNDHFEIELDKFLDYPSKISFLANPNAHTGILLPLTQIDAFLKSYSGLLVVDEAYIDFADPGESAYNLINNYDNLLVLRTFSKSFSLCGIRVGFAFGHPDLITALDKTKDSYNIAYLNQIAAQSAIEDYDYMLYNARQIVADREWFKEKLEQLGFDSLPSSGNFLFTRHNYLAAQEICQALLEYRILVRHFNEQRINNFIRITIGTHEQMQSVLKALEEIIFNHN